MNAGSRSSRFVRMPNLKYLPNGRFRAKSNVSWVYCVAGVMDASDTLRQRDADTRSMNDGHGLQMHRRFQNGLALLVLVNLFGCGTLTPSAPAPDVVLVFNVNEPAEAIAPDEAPTFASAPIAATIEGKSGSHAATILALDDGELLAGWYSYEGPHELDGSAVYLARRRIGASAWDPPILHRATAGGIGNPVLYAEGDRVWLFQAVVAGGWSTSSIEFQVSDDRGLTWSSPFRIAGPLGSNVHAPPLRTRDGRLLLPAYDDLLQRCLFFTSSDGLSWELNSVVATPWPHQAIQPAAVAYWSALHYWNMTEQVPHTVFVQSTRRKRPVEVLGMRFRFVTVSQARFFGVARRTLDGKPIYVTDREKTLLDVAARPDLSGGVKQLAQALRAACADPSSGASGRSLDWARLDDYLARWGGGVVVKRLGYLVEALSLPVPDLDRRLERWQGLLSKGISLLEPAAQAKGPVVTRWRIRVNVAVTAPERNAR